MSSPEKDFPESEMSNDPTGMTAPPGHYGQEEREVIDQCRDMATDREFAKFCQLTAFIYRKRAPYKGTPELDAQKATFYEVMQKHVETGGATPDPRVYRAGQQPYQRQPAGPMQEAPFSMDQEPTVMPGFTALATDPWPPLSREQVVELHEGLLRFREEVAQSWEMKGERMALHQRGAGVRLDMMLAGLGIGVAKQKTPSVGPELLNALLEFRSKAETPSEDPTSRDHFLVEDLMEVLRDLGIGTPPTTKRWSEEELQGISAKVQEIIEEEGPGLETRCGLPRYTLGAVPHPTATELAILESLGREAPTQGPDIQTMKGSMEELWALQARGHARDRLQRRVAEEIREPTATLVTSPLGEVKHNCGTCRFLSQKYYMICTVEAAKMEASRGWRLTVEAGLRSDQHPYDVMLSEADNCPNWEQKP